MDTLTIQTPANEGRSPDVGSGDGFGPNDLHRGSPLCVCETYALLRRELARKQGMVDDLKQLADDNFGLTPEDCDLLTQAVTDRDHIRAALTALRGLFA